VVRGYLVSLQCVGGDRTVKQGPEIERRAWCVASKTGGNLGPEI